MSPKDRIRRSKYKVLVETNVFNIPERLREIDSGYFVVFNSKRNKFEVHNETNIGNSYCFTVPFDKLDCRTITHCRKTLVGGYGDKIYAEMEKNNRKIQESRHRAFKNEMEARAKYTRPLFRKTAEALGI